MKKLLIISAILAVVGFKTSQSYAQVNLNINIGPQPAWVPVGYQDVNYYYLPEVQSYYHVPEREFVYLNGNRWTRSRYLPSRYRSYNLNYGRKIVMYGNNPYRSYHIHRVKYAGYGPMGPGHGPRPHHRPPHLDHRHHGGPMKPGMFPPGPPARHGRP